MANNGFLQPVLLKKRFEALFSHPRRSDVMRILRNMKAPRQVAAVELMVASNTITMAHVDALLKATPPEQRADGQGDQNAKRSAPRGCKSPDERQNG